jgi:K+/H+ antiporter YhaU regulatory subunit KhtT
VTAAFLDSGKLNSTWNQDRNKDLQSTLLIRRKKELKGVQTLLEKKRAEFSKRMEECKEKQEELKTKQRQLRERVQKFEKFLRENDAKRQRALAKALSERKLREQKVH